MYKIKKPILTMSTILAVFYLGQAHAHTSVMDFDTPEMPAAVFSGFGQVYSQNEFETTSIDFDTGPNTSHIHGALNLATASRVSQLEADAGGALFRSTTPGSDFSFESWDMVTLNTAITTGGDSAFHVVGLNDGIQVASTTLTSAAEGTNVDFLFLDNGFGNVDLVEYWFDPAGRGVDPATGVGLLNLLAEVDNVSFGDAIPAVPEPETYAMLLVGLGLVGFAANRRRTYH